MGRRRAWDESDLLERAMGLFRRRGYARTSVRDLEVATGQHAASLYQAYQSKDGLFVAALGAYVEQVVKRRIETHLGAADPLFGIQRYFGSTFDDGPDNPGCLLTNSAVESRDLDQVAQAEIAAGLRLIEEGLEAALRRARAQGQLSSDARPEHLAALLLALYQGILVLIRAGTPTATLAAITEIGLATISKNGPAPEEAPCA